MMSFLARSALCIGAVAAAASGAGPERLIAAIGREARDAAEGAGRACLSSDGCRRAGAGALAAAGPSTGASGPPPVPGRRGVPRAAARPAPKADPAAE